jgi:hypothetical protein
MNPDAIVEPKQMIADAIDLPEEIHAAGLCFVDSRSRYASPCRRSSMAPGSARMGSALWRRY